MYPVLTKESSVKEILKLHFKKSDDVIFNICNYWNVEIVRKNGAFYWYEEYDDGTDSHYLIGKTYKELEERLIQEIDFAQWCKDR